MFEVPCLLIRAVDRSVQILSLKIKQRKLFLVEGPAPVNIKEPGRSMSIAGIEAINLGIILVTIVRTFKFLIDLY